jgi:hypothetical protein
MIHFSRHLKRLPVIVGFFVVVGALIAAGSASANHPNVGLSPYKMGFVVPAFKQCNANSYGAQAGQHGVPLALPACSFANGAQTKNGPGLVSGTDGTAAIGPDLNKPIWPYSIRYTSPGLGAPCTNPVQGAIPANTPGPDVCLNVDMGSLVTFTTDQPPYTASAPYDPAGTTDLAAVARIRITDHYNCVPAPCLAPDNGTGLPGTVADTDFGPVPFSCAIVAGKSSCNLNTTSNAVVGPNQGQHAVTFNGIKTEIQIFRLRVIAPAKSANSQLVGQEGIAWD